MLAPTQKKSYFQVSATAVSAAAATTLALLASYFILRAWLEVPYYVDVMAGTIIGATGVTLERFLGPPS